MSATSFVGSKIPTPGASITNAHGGDKINDILEKLGDLFPYHAVVSKKGSTWTGRLRDGTYPTGAQGSAFGTVLTNTLAGLTSGRSWIERVLILGEATIDNSVSPVTIPDYTDIELYGKLSPQDKTKTMLSGGNYNGFKGGILDGVRAGTNGGDVGVRVLHYSGKNHLRLRDFHVINGWSRGLEVDMGNDDIDIVIDGVYSENCWRNIMCWSDPAIMDTVAGTLKLSNIDSYNGVDSNIDTSCGRMAMANINAFGAATSGRDIIADGWRELQFSNLHCDGMQVIVSSIGVFGERVIVDGLQCKSFYMSILPALNHIILNKIQSKNADGHGIQIRIAGANNIGDIILDDITVSNCTQNGVTLVSDSTGRFQKVSLGQIITRNVGGAFKGVDINHADYVINEGSIYSENGINLNLSKRTRTIGSSAVIITAGNTASSAINHFCAATPKVFLTPTTDTLGKRFWYTVTSTTFTVYIDSAAASDISFDWWAQVRQ